MGYWTLSAYDHYGPITPEEEKTSRSATKDRTFPPVPEKTPEQKWLDTLQILESGGMKILVSDDVLMLDWDMTKSATEKGGQGYPQTATINTRDDAARILREYTQYLPSSIKSSCGFRLYWTPNGVRGFLTSHRIRAGTDDATWIQRTLRVDNAYRYITDLNKRYACRVSRKERDDDFVACYWMTWGNREIDPWIMKYLKVHDELCRLGRGDVPQPIVPKTTLEGLLRSQHEEPWEPANTLVLSDFIDELGDIPF